MKVNVVVLFAILALVPGAFAAPLCSGAGGTLDFGVNIIAEGSVEAATFTCAGLQFDIIGANFLTVVFFEPSGLVSDILTLTNVSPTLANINFVSDTELPLNLPPPPFSTITEP